MTRHCAWCSERPTEPGTTSMLCTDCESLMLEAADKDMSDLDLVLLVVRHYGKARYQSAIWPVAENADALDRAFQRVIRVLEQTLGREKKSGGRWEGTHRTAGDDAHRGATTPELNRRAS